MSAKQRTAVREIFGLGTTTSIPVHVVPGGYLPPKLIGTTGGHFTKGGRRVYHPNAYARKGWSNLIYLCSSRRIYVGEKWVETSAK